jgi:hypothetical protein
LTGSGPGARFAHHRPLRWRQGLETLALEQGQKHAQLLDDVASSRQFIVDELIPKSAEAGIPRERLAKLLG